MAKSFGSWRNIGPCVLGKTKTCGKGEQYQTRKCTEGTQKYRGVSHLCSNYEKEQTISCNVEC